MKILGYFLLCYLVFFGRMLPTNSVLKAGKDIMRISYPARQYLYTTLKHGEFPFWTEKMFAGYPIYLDAEAGYLNLPNVGLTYLFGPMAAFKLLHIFTYLVGAVCFYKFLRHRAFTIPACALSHTIYFFTFFSLFQQQHQAITFAYYLFPTFLWTLDRYVATSKLCYLLAWGALFTHLLYFGAFQMLFVTGLVSALFIVLHQKTAFIHLKRYLLVALLVCSMCLPLLTGYSSMYLQSQRASTDFSWLAGSFSPVQLASLILPFPYRQPDYYLGTLVNKDFSIQEISIYIGIVAFSLSILGILYSNLPRKDSVFLLTLLGVFLVLGFARSTPLVHLQTIPGISWFRYWGRLIFVAIFALAVYAGHFYALLSKTMDKESIKLSTVNLKVLAGFCLYLVALIIGNLTSPDFATSVKVVLRNDYRLDYWYIYLPLALFSLWFLVTVRLGRYRLLYNSQKFIFAAVVLDTVLFGLVVEKGWFIQLHDLYTLEAVNSTAFKNTRIVVTDGDARGNTFLYHNFWTPFGLAASTDSHYAATLKSAGFSSITQVASKDLIETRATTDRNFLNGLELLGIKAVVNSQGHVFYRNLNPLMFYLKQPETTASIESLEQEEMTHKLKITVSKQSQVASYIKYDPAWSLTVNGQLQTIQQHGMFLSFTVPSGVNTVVLHYLPRNFFNILWTSVILSFTVGLVMFLTERGRDARKQEAC